MPVTDADVDAIKTRVIELEKKITDIGKSLQSNPDSMALSTAFEKAKDEITKLNLRIEQLEKPRSTPHAKEETPNDDADKEDEWDI